ncbi:hypothetical protein CA267_005740 [Alteromonas pelagimontana]|uniref:Uncharacterized protein n=1 Tax=Alteromonas pelagimontana TaxID=1858656 RepID=A0A6M4MAX3_9ALTE|nr:hypothetical protein [Alteromonas pelagimontana]QJR80313.1 hypothetical protein CA267_005740 [Alteromonas pelagimontana]
MPLEIVKLSPSKRRNIILDGSAVTFLLQKFGQKIFTYRLKSSRYHFPPNYPAYSAKQKISKKGLAFLSRPG